MKKVIKDRRIFRAFLILLAVATALILLPLMTPPARAGLISAEVPVGSLPQGVAVNTSTNKIYVTNYASNSVTVIDGQTHDVITSVNVGNNPIGVAVDEENNKIYVANSGSSSVSVINGTNDTVGTTITVTAIPRVVAWNPVTDTIYVAHGIMKTEPANHYEVSVIDISSGTVTDTVSVEGYPSALAVNPDTNKIYLPQENGTLTVIDGSDNETTNIAVGSYPEGVAVNPNTNKIYVVNYGDSAVKVLDGVSLGTVTTVPIEGALWGAGVNANTNKIYVVNQSGGTVAVINGANDTVVQTIQLSGNASPIALAVDKIHNQIYVPSMSTNNLTIIDGTVIESAGMTNLTAPAQGALPQTAGNITPGDARYTVTGLTWENLNGSPADLNGGNFANAGCLYQARIELTAQPGFKFPEDGLTPAVNAGMSSAGTVSGGDVLGNKLTFVVTFPADITTVSITGLAAPEAGAVPAASTDLAPSNNTAQYTVTGLTWVDGGGTPASFVDSGGKFPYGGSWFRARIELTANPGYKFQEGGLTPAVDGDGTAALGVVSGGNISGNKLTFDVSFSDNIAYYEAYILNLAPPTAGETPQVAGDLETYYSTNAGRYFCSVSGLTWKNSDGTAATLSGGKFTSGGSAYRAIIELTSLTGYKFPSDFTPYIDNDGIYVSGTVSGGYVSGNKLTLVIAFSDDITAAGLSGLAAPVTGGAPSTNLVSSEPAKFRVDEIEWQNSDGSPASLTGGKFNASSVYKAVIKLESKEGFKFPVAGLTPAVSAGTPTAGTMYGMYASGNWLEFEVTFPATAAAPNNNGGGGSPGTPSTTDYNVTVKGGGNDTTLKITVDTSTGGAVLDLGALSGSLLGGDEPAAITIPAIANVHTYTLGIPASQLSEPNGSGSLTLNTAAGSLTISSGMLSGIDDADGKKAEITIGQGDKTGLPADVKAAIGDRPLISLSLSIDGKHSEWNNPNAPVTVSIPYTPTAAELLHPESIVIWYIDGSGNAISIPSGHYDPATGMVTFSTTHFSFYAVGYKAVSFSDVASTAWYYKPVSFVAARGITTGTGGESFSPDAALTRGEFIVMLMRAYSIAPDKAPADNFSDAGSAYYTDYLAAAKRLGISAGVGNNMFMPEKEITRQEMFTLLYNALKVIGSPIVGDAALGIPSGKTLADFTDAGQIDAWAKDAVSHLVQTGIVGGQDGKLTPDGTTTRAEMAQVLYKLLSQ